MTIKVLSAAVFLFGMLFTVYGAPTTQKTMVLASIRQTEANCPPSLNATACRSIEALNYVNSIRTNVLKLPALKSSPRLTAKALESSENMANAGQLIGPPIDIQNGIFEGAIASGQDGQRVRAKLAARLAVNTWYGDAGTLETLKSQQEAAGIGIVTRDNQFWYATILLGSESVEGPDLPNFSVPQ